MGDETNSANQLFENGVTTTSRPTSLSDEVSLEPHLDRWARLGVTWPS